jgi:hypothetical protein
MYDRNNGKSFVGAPTTNTLPSPAINGLPTYGNTWGTYNTNQYNNNTYFSIGSIVSVVNNIVTTSGNHPLRSYDVVTPQTTGGGLTAGANYLVKKLSNTTFSLHTHNSSQDGSQGYINPATGNFKVYDDFANDVRISINATSFPTMWWGYPHLPNSALVKEIIPGGFNGLPEGPVTDCIRLHFHRTDTTDGMAYSADATVTAGNAWTVSFWARAVTQSAAGITNSFQVYNYGGANSPSNPSMSWTLGAVGVWQRYSLTWTANNPSAISYWFSGAGGCKFDIANIQYELGSTPSNFTTGTRSNTQALLDLTKRNTITATSLTYASNGSFSFNGSSDQLTLSTFDMNILSTQQITLEAWVRHTNLTGSQAYINNWFNFTGGDQRGVILRTFNGQAFPSFWWCWGTDYNAVYADSFTMSPGVWYHVVGTYTKNVAARIYVNGVLYNSTTNTSVNNDIVYDTTNRFKIGQSNINGSWMNGLIDQAKVYNRALTASEVQQNFNAQRTRFGL